MKVKMIANATMAVIKNNKTEVKEYTSGWEYEVSDNVYKNIKLSCEKITKFSDKYKNKQMKTE